MTYLGSPDGAQSDIVQTDARFRTSIHVPLSTDPLSLNKRLHWRTVARLTKQWRDFAGYSASHFPALGKCSVTLTWHVIDNRRRDEDNLFRLCKALCDGLVDAGVVADDTSVFMEKRCRIVIEDRKLHSTAWMTLDVEQVTA